MRKAAKYVIDAAILEDTRVKEKGDKMAQKY